MGPAAAAAAAAAAAGAALGCPYAVKRLSNAVEQAGRQSPFKRSGLPS